MHCLLYPFVSRWARSIFFEKFLADPITDQEDLLQVSGSIQGGGSPLQVANSLWLKTVGIDLRESNLAPETIAMVKDRSENSARI